jgi:hypothetical protein
VASPHAHALVTSLKHGRLPAVFKGHTSINGSTQVTTGLTGRIGRDHFTGSGSGTTAGNVVQSGTVYLANSQGTIELELSTASVVGAGRRMRQEVPVVVVAATGKYAPFVHTTGVLTTWNVPARSGATSTFSGYLMV